MAFVLLSFYYVEVTHTETARLHHVHLPRACLFCACFVTGLMQLALWGRGDEKVIHAALSTFVTATCDSNLLCQDADKTFLNKLTEVAVLNADCTLESLWELFKMHC